MLRPGAELWSCALGGAFKQRTDRVDYSNAKATKPDRSRRRPATATARNVVEANSSRIYTTLTQTERLGSCLGNLAEQGRLFFAGGRAAGLNQSEAQETSLCLRSRAPMPPPLRQRDFGASTDIAICHQPLAIGPDLIFPGDARPFGSPRQTRALTKTIHKLPLH
jgi:hypothetical protein